ncbi:MAG: fructose-1,6-bisphosphatase [Euryarchaeota archaeon]|nr:fructose-1,6-bisphosphatase [Euryarchaeota archaeon]
MKVTISLIKADVGSLAGHHIVIPKQIEVAKQSLEEAEKNGLIIDHYVFNCGDDLELLMVHTKGENNPEIHKLAWDTFKEVTEKVSKPLKLYAAGQDLLKEAFAGTVKGMGPGVAEMEIEERISEPFIVVAADKTSTGGFNLPLFRIFGDPSNTAGLIIDPKMHGGFIFRVLDVKEGKHVDLACPAEMYDLITLIGTTERYVIERVYRADDKLLAAVSSTTRLSLIAGKYVGKDDPCMIIRMQHGLPAVGEVLVAFSEPWLVPGFMRGSHYGPIMPVSLKNAVCTVFDGPPRVVALGFNLSNGQLVGLRGEEPADLFDDPAFDRARAIANDITAFMRRMGEFMPARLGPEEMEYTTLPKVLEKLKDRKQLV